MIEFKNNGLFIINNKDEYRLNRINKVWAIKLSKYDQVKRILLLSLSFSTVGWVSAYWGKGLSVYVALVLFCIGLIYSLLSFRRYELRAEFKATDETGNQAVTIMHTSNHDEFMRIREIAEKLSLRIEPA